MCYSPSLLARTIFNASLNQICLQKHGFIILPQIRISFVQLFLITALYFSTVVILWQPVG